MNHLNDSEIWILVHDLEDHSNWRLHLHQCEECRRRFSEAAETLVDLKDSAVQGLTHHEKSKMFETAWGNLTERTKRFPDFGIHRWLQPTLTFGFGLLLGFLIFSQDSGPVAHVPSADSPVMPPNEERAGVPTEHGEEGEDVWRMAGLRNVRITPTTRIEDGQAAPGAILEAETLHGTLVVWNF